MVNSCSAFNCSNKFVTGSNKTFHRFPFRDPELLQKWLTAVRRKNFQPTKTSILCSDHFEESCFNRTGQTTRLRESAIPTLFNFSTSPTRRQGRKRKELDEGWLDQMADKSGSSGDQDPLMVRSCCAVGCRERHFQGAFHSFPRNPKRRRVWTKALKRKDFSPTKDTWICSKHFTLDSFTRRFGEGNVLKKNAVPTIFSSTELEKRNRKVYRPSHKESAVSCHEVDSAALEEIQPDIKEEPLDLDRNPLREASSEVWLPHFTSAFSLQPVVCLTRLPLTVASQAPTQRLWWIPESGAPGRFITLNNTRLDEGASHSATSGEVLSTHPELLIIPDHVKDPKASETSSMVNQVTKEAVPSRTQVNTDLLESQVLPDVDDRSTTESYQSTAEPIQGEDTPLPLSTVASGDEAPPMNVVFVKVMDDSDEEPKLCVIETTTLDGEIDETTNGVTTWMMNSKPAEGGQDLAWKRGSDGSQTVAESEDEDSDSDVVSPVEEVAWTPSESTDLPSGTVLPNLVLVGPLSHSEEKLADLQTKLVHERHKSAMLQRRFDRERTRKNAQKHKVKILQQKLRRLQNKVTQLQLGKGVTLPSADGGDAEEDDFAWYEV